MELIHQFIYFVTHLDTSLATFITNYGSWAYALLFLIIFCETGLVVTPFLPGDSLLFAAGSIAAHHLISIHWLIITLTAAALLGDQTNYWIGRNIGHLLIKMKDSWYFKKAYLDKTHAYYEKYGGKTLIIGRFIPILRTFAPFVAGLSEMRYRKFCLFSVSGGILWITLVSLLGYFFSQIPVVKNNFTIVIFVIIIISVLPAFIEIWRARLRKKRASSSQEDL